MIIKGKNVAFKLQGKVYHCAMDITMDYIGGKWKAVVLWYLKNGTHRFAELKKLIPKAGMTEVYKVVPQDQFKAKTQA